MIDTPLLRISVVIPVFQRQQQLDQALLSLTTELGLIHEIIVVDDASSLPVVINISLPHRNKVKLIRLHVNVGSSAARQAGIERAEGELVAFLDSDDIWLPNKLEAQLTHFKSADALLAVSIGWQIRDLENKVSGCRIPIAPSSVEDFAAGCWFCPGSTVLITRSALLQIGSFDTQLRRLEDLDWYLRFALAGGRLQVAPVVGVVITKSRHQRRSDIENAAKRILAKDYYKKDCPARTALRRNLVAWLYVERAAAARNERDLISAGIYLVLSFLKKPRLSGYHLKKWWDTTPPIIDIDAYVAQLETLRD